MLVGIQATCQQCRQAKVKCDMGLPCGRCVRLGKACLPSAPSRRGQKRKAAPAAAAAGAAAEDYPAGHLHNVVGELVDGAKAAGTALRGLHPGILYLAREWIGIALRKRSAKLLAKAFNLCSKASMPLDSVVGDCGGAHLHALFAPSNHPVILTPRPRLTELPACMLDMLGELENATILVRFVKDGMLSYIATPLFEETIAAAAKLEQIYAENKKDALRDVFGDNHGAVLSQTGAMFFSVKTLPMMEPRSVLFPQIQVRLRSGRYACSKLRVSLWIGANDDELGGGGAMAGSGIIVFELIAPTATDAGATATVLSATAKVARPGMSMASSNTSRCDSTVEWHLPPLLQNAATEEQSSLGDTAFDGLDESFDSSMLPPLDDNVLRELCKTVMGGTSPR